MAGSSLSSSPNFETGLNAALIKAISDCRDCVQKLKEDHADSGMPITDDCTSLHRLSAKLEFLLQAHMKSRGGVLGRKRDYWEYMVRCLATRKNVHDGIKFVKACPEYKTSLGRGRALLRFCLVHQCLADTIQQCVMEGQVTSDYYKPNSPLLRHELSSDLIDSLYLLNEVQFDLNPTGHDLDVAWPTFSKTGAAGAMFNNWRPPSRAMSISSLDSSFSTAGGDNGLSSSHVDSSMADIDERHEAELFACRAEMDDLRFQVETLAKENVVLKRNQSTASSAEKTETGIQTDPDDQDDGFEREQLLNLRACLVARDEEMRNLSVANSTLKDEIEELRVQLASQAEDYERAISASAEAQTELQRLSRTLAIQETVVTDLEAKLADFEMDRSSELDRSLRMNESLHDELAEKSALADELEKKVEQYASVVGNLKDSLGSVCCELAALGTPKSPVRSVVFNAEPILPRVNGDGSGSIDALESEERLETREDVEAIMSMEGKIRALADAVRSHVGEFDMDNMLLREGLVKLLKEKDRLWHHNNRLVQLFRQLMRENWSEDEVAETCSGCGAPFSLMLRRHHCRLCGKFFCYSCTDHYVSLAATRSRTRVCRHCFGLVQKINLDGNSSFSQDEQDPEGEEDGRAESNGIDGDGPLGAVGDGVANTLPPTKRKNMGFEETAAPILSYPRPGTIGDENQEEQFTVISSGEIRSVRAEAAECPAHVMCPSKLYEPVSIADLVQHDASGVQRTAGDEGSVERRESESDLSFYPTTIECWVTARSSLGVPISLPIQPCVIAWAVECQGKLDLNFAVTYRASVDVGSTECLLKLKRLVTGSSRGLLKVRRSGLYTFVFDNTYSSLTAKKVVLRLRLDKEPTPSKGIESEN